MNNIIYNDNDEAIGYYDDIVELYKQFMEERPEEQEDLQRELDEIKEWANYAELLVLSENNGMGFTCKPYQPNNN